MQLFTLTGRIATPDNVPVQGCVVRAFMLPTRVILEDTGIAQTVKTKTNARGEFTLSLIKAEGVRYSIQTEAPERLPSGLVVDPWTLPGDTASLADLTTAAPGPLPPLQLGLTEDEKTRLQAIPPAVDSLDSRVTALEGDSDALTVVSTGPVDLDDSAPVGTMRGFVVTADGVVIEGTTTKKGTWVAVKEAAKNGDASGWRLYQAGAGGGATGTTDPTPPSAITGLAVTSKTDSTVTLSWTAASDPETAVTYERQVTPSGGNAGSWVSITPTGTSTLTGTVSGLTPGAYTIAVRPRSGGGVGPGQSVTVTLVQSYDTAIRSLSPAFYLPLTDPAGTTTPAEHGSNTAVLTASGSVTFGAAGIGGYGTGAAFSGGTIAEPSSGAQGLNGATSWWVSAIIKPATVGTQNLAAQQATFTLAINSAGSPQIIINGKGTAAASTKVASAKVAHVAATYDGSTLRIFHDGVERGSSSIAAAVLNSYSTAPLTLSFDGTMNGVAGGKTALTAQQVLDLARSAGVA